MLKFSILTDNRDHQLDHTVEPILINRDHIISIKPINIMVGDQVLEGYWLRTSNGKKYRAIKIPEQLKKLLQGEQKGSLPTGQDAMSVSMQ